MTQHYRITNRTSGAVLGIFEGDSAVGACHAMYRDAGYSCTAAAAAALGISIEDLDDDLVVEEIECEVYERHADGTPALWTEVSEVAGAMTWLLCDHNDSVPIESATDLASLVDQWRRIMDD